MTWTPVSPGLQVQVAFTSIMAVPLQNVVDDILIHILRMLPLEDVLSVRQVNTTSAGPLSFDAHLLDPLDIEAT